LLRPFRAKFIFLWHPQGVALGCLITALQAETLSISSHVAHCAAHGLQTMSAAELLAMSRANQPPKETYLGVASI
jgi:hypothetical protein